MTAPSVATSVRPSVAIEHALREAVHGWVRVRAVTPTNVIAISPAQMIRR